MKPDEFCDILGRRRTDFGERDVELPPEHDVFIRQTYYSTYNTSAHGERRRVRNYLQAIRRLSDYIWILVATSLTYTHLAHLPDLDGCLEVIKSWKEAYPISECQESSARAILQPLDDRKEETVNGRTQDYKPESR
ncbi:uncharacterized protein BDV17DRAFT_116536 [Aspergillus undulatus]|uniref:uncharacterized protein n=1 Tax=Aspergillus undulatus TaxID=1810928 RepID=UPI003CCD9C52